MALRIRSLATVVPPITSTSTSTSGLLATSNTSRVILYLEVSQLGLSRRAPICTMVMSQPARASISALLRVRILTVPLPTVPRPQIPILTGFKVDSSSNANESYANIKKDGHHTHGGRQCQLRFGVTVR